MLDVIAESRGRTAGALIALAAASAAAPLVAPLAAAAGAALAWRRWARTSRFPLRAPMDSRRPDPSEAHPATGRPMPAEGACFLGNEIGTGREVWLSTVDMRQHLLDVGSTGSGITETMLGFAANALAWGSGFAWVDGRGDVSLFAKVSAIAKRFGREDDLLVLNFMTGNEDGGGRRLSHRMNPFATGSADGLAQLVVSLLDEIGGDGAMWKGRAIAMLTGVLRALVWYRDAGLMPLSPGVLRGHLGLKAILGMVNDERLPVPIAKMLMAYLSSLPGFNLDRGERQAQTTLDQHGYLEMQFTRILGIMADVYPHVFSEDGVDVDLHDVVANRRVLLVLLPALEKSGDEIANLGKVVVSALKGMMGGLFGSKLEGDWASVIENRPSRSAPPYVCIFNDCGYYLVDGMALMAAQARSLGLSMIYATQDIPSMKRMSEREAASIIANTNTKIFMRTCETESVEPLVPAACTPAMLSRLKAQNAGEGRVAWRDRFVAMRSFYVWGGWKWQKNLRLTMPKLVTLGGKEG
jgi:intracellular multiplication protein IcmO